MWHRFRQPTLEKINYVRNVRKNMLQNERLRNLLKPMVNHGMAIAIGSSGEFVKDVAVDCIIVPIKEASSPWK
jgi:hypothetical protein